MGEHHLSQFKDLILSYKQKLSFDSVTISLKGIGHFGDYHSDQFIKQLKQIEFMPKGIHTSKIYYELSKIFCSLTTINIRWQYMKTTTSPRQHKNINEQNKQLL